MIHKAKELSREQKTALEALVGRELSDEEDISIRVLQRPSVVSNERRSEILRDLKAFFAEVDRQHEPLSGSDADEILTEAIRSARPGYRPQQ